MSRALDAVARALLAVFLWASKDQISQNGQVRANAQVDRGFLLHNSVQQFIKKYLESRTAFRLSQPKLDPDTGWQRLAGDDWRLFGFIEPTNGVSVPWSAEITDCGPGATHDIKLLEIGGVAVFTKATQRFRATGFQRTPRASEGISGLAPL